MSPVDEIAADRMPPAHVAPGIPEGIVLVEEVKNLLVLIVRKTYTIIFYVDPKFFLLCSDRNSHFSATLLMNAEFNRIVNYPVARVQKEFAIPKNYRNRLFNLVKKTQSLSLVFSSLSLA